MTHTTRQLGLYYAAHARRVDLDRTWRANLPKWEKLTRSLALHVLKMAVTPADRRGFLADVVLYLHVCFRAARARRKRSAGGTKRPRTTEPAPVVAATVRVPRPAVAAPGERQLLYTVLESRGISYSKKMGTLDLRRKLKDAGPSS